MSTPPTRTGRFIVLEGLDGCGKSTQARRLVAWLEARGRLVLHTREPGGTPLGERVRKLLLDPATGHVAGRAEMLLYQVARAQLVETVLRPTLATGADVVCERWHYATEAYQGARTATEGEGGVPAEVVARASAIATAGLEPDRAILLQLDDDRGQHRIDGPLDRIEQRGAAYREQVAAAYAAIFARDPERLRVVAAEGSIESVGQRVITAVEDLFHDE